MSWQLQYGFGESTWLWSRLRSAWKAGLLLISPCAFRFFCGRQLKCSMVGRNVNGPPVTQLSERLGLKIWA